MTPTQHGARRAAQLVGPPPRRPPHPTVVDALEAAARTDAPLFVFHGGGPEPVSRGGRALRDGAARWAGALARAGLRRGDRVLVLLHAGPDFVECFLGAMLGGYVPVPLATPLTFGGVERHLSHLALVAASAEPAAVVTTPRLATALAGVPALRARVPALLVPADAASAPLGAPSPSVDPTGTAFLQYTSGTTGAPKGVVVSHGALVANAAAIAQGLALGEDDVGVSWLPPFHDMGLVGALLTTVCHPYPVHVLPPERFVMRPASWLELVARTGATVSAAPNFAYALCAEKAAPPPGLRLDRWRAALDGAEPVRAETLDRFVERFASYGLRREAFLPVYGLAEHTLAVAFPPLGRGCDALRVDRDALAAGHVTPRDEGMTLASVGGPVAGTSVRVRARDASAACAEEGVVGELEVHGDSRMDGYFRDDAATAAVLRDGWLRTGDLGFVHDGELFISGRAKDMVVVSGRNVYPSDVEGIAAGVEGLTGGVAAFGRYDPRLGTETLVVAVEARVADDAARARIAREVTGELLCVLGLRAEVRVVGVGTLPRTTSGKIRRGACAAVV